MKELCEIKLKEEYTPSVSPFRKLALRLKKNYKKRQQNDKQFIRTQTE